MKGGWMPGGDALVILDASEVARVGKALMRLPQAKIRTAIARAYSTTYRRLRADVARRIAEGTDLPPRQVGDKITVFRGGEELEIRVRSPWIPLAKMGAARQYGSRSRIRGAGGRFTGARRAGGVTVKGWGRHEGAFIASVGGHRGVFARVSASRLPIKELWGPNPAAYVVKHDAAFEAHLNDMVRVSLVPEILRQVEVLLAEL